MHKSRDSMQDQFQLEKIGNSITVSKTFMAGFSLDPLDMGGGIWVDKYREESVNGGGTYEGGHGHYGGT